MAGMCHLTPPEVVANGIIRPLGFNPLWTPTVQLANVIDQMAYYSRMNLLLDRWDQPVGVPGPGVFGLPITDAEKAPSRIAYLGASGPGSRGVDPRPGFIWREVGPIRFCST